MLWLCLHFHQLPLEVFIPNKVAPDDLVPEKLIPNNLISATLAKNTLILDDSESGIGTEDHPTVIIDQHRVLMANYPATNKGVTAGMSLATAQAMCGEAKVFDRDIQLEAQALQTLAYSCYRFTPAVVLCPPDSLLLEIGGCLKLFKGLQRLLDKVGKAISGQGHEYTVGLAATPKAARLLSRAGINPLDFFNSVNGTLNSTEAFEQYLHNLPLTLLDCSNKLKDKFRSTGFYCLSDLLNLPGAALGKRYGKGFLIYLKQLTGEQADPQQNLELPPQFKSTLAFNDEITSTERLAFPIKRLLLALSGYLHGRQLHCSQIRWSMRLSPVKQGGDNNNEIILHFAQPHNSLEHFLSMSRLKLGNLVLPTPVESLTLHAEHLHQAEQKNTDLFGSRAGDSQLSKHLNSHFGDQLSNNNDLTMLLDKLRTRLGENSVYGLELADSHIPEQAWQSLPLNSIKRSKTPIVNTATDHDSSAKRPLWLWQNPLPVKITNQGLYWRGELELLQGPERIEGNWWQKPVCRDYFVARHQGGALYWLYRDRLAKRWFIHGAFA